MVGRCIVIRCHVYFYISHVKIAMKCGTESQSNVSDINEEKTNGLGSTQDFLINCKRFLRWMMWQFGLFLQWLSTDKLGNIDIPYVWSRIVYNHSTEMNMCEFSLQFSTGARRDRDVTQTEIHFDEKNIDGNVWIMGLAFALSSS